MAPPAQDHAETVTDLADKLSWPTQLWTMAVKERDRTCREALIEDARYTLGDREGEEKSQSIERSFCNLYVGLIEAARHILASPSPPWR